MVRVFTSTQVKDTMRKLLSHTKVNGKMDRSQALANRFTLIKEFITDIGKMENVTEKAL